MKIIFLDIDGVLCTLRAAIPYGDSGIIRKFDPVVIDMLNSICDRTEAKIVISSSWRKESHDLGLVFQAAGIYKKHLFFKKEDSNESGNGFYIENYVLSEPNDNYRRGNEIKEWLDRHPEVKKYIILDDSTDFLQEQLKYHIHTDMYNGMMFEDYRKAIDLLNEID